MSKAALVTYASPILNKYVYPNPKEKPVALRIADAVLTPARLALGAKTVEVTYGKLTPKEDARVTSAFLRVLLAILAFTLLLVPTLVCLAIKACSKGSQEKKIEGLLKTKAPILPPSKPPSTPPAMPLSRAATASIISTAAPGTVMGSSMISPPLSSSTPEMGGANPPPPPPDKTGSSGAAAAAPAGASALPVVSRSSGTSMANPGSVTTQGASGWVEVVPSPGRGNKFVYYSADRLSVYQHALFVQVGTSGGDLEALKRQVALVLPEDYTTIPFQRGSFGVTTPPDTHRFLVVPKVGCLVISDQECRRGLESLAQPLAPAAAAAAPSDPAVTRSEAAPPTSESALPSRWKSSHPKASDLESLLTAAKLTPDEIDCISRLQLGQDLQSLEDEDDVDSIRGSANTRIVLLRGYRALKAQFAALYALGAARGLSDAQTRAIFKERFGVLAGKKDQALADAFAAEAAEAANVVPARATPSAAAVVAPPPAPTAAAAAVATTAVAAVNRSSVTKGEVTPLDMTIPRFRFEVLEEGSSTPPQPAKVMVTLLPNEGGRTGGRGELLRYLMWNTRKNKQGLTGFDGLCNFDRAYRGDIDLPDSFIVRVDGDAISKDGKRAKDAVAALKSLETQRYPEVR